MLTRIKGKPPPKSARSMGRNPPYLPPPDDLWVQLVARCLHARENPLYLVGPNWSDQNSAREFPILSTNSTLSNEIATVLRGEILDQRYREGERLPSERDLAARFNASRGAVREAFSQLEQLGLIDIQLGGTRVQSLHSASLAVLGPLMARTELPDPVLVRQFLQTFGALAALSAREAVQSANQEQMNRIRELVVNLSKLTKDFQAMSAQWHELLEFLTEVSGNLVVQLIGNDLKAQFVEQMVGLDIQPQIKKRVLDDVLNALKQCLMDQDGGRAAAAVTRYFDALSEAVTEAIEAKQAAYSRQAS